jgi:hypothetical protein
MGIPYPLVSLVLARILVHLLVLLITLLPNMMSGKTTPLQLLIATLDQHLQVAQHMLFTVPLVPQPPQNQATIP